MSIDFRFAAGRAACLARQWVALPLAAGTAMIAGCVSVPPVQTRVHAVADERIEIFWVRAYPGKDGVLVTGQVCRAGVSKPALGGHLHVSANLADSERPVSIDTRWTGSLSARVRRSARFSVLIPAVPNDRLHSIRVEYRDSRDAVPKGSIEAEGPSVPVVEGSHD